MKILIACEESQAICKAFRKLGFEAYSCDLQECSGGHPEWHAKADAIDMLYASKWDLVIAHPPCPFLTNSSNGWLTRVKETPGFEWSPKYGIYMNFKRYKEMEKAAMFFNEFVRYRKKGNKIAIENPIPHKYAVEKIGKYSQVIQPYMFGHTERKATCLWLFGLPELKETNNVMEAMKKLPKNEQQRIHYLPPGKERAKLRSKTFQGIADAIAMQWGNYLLSQSENSYLL